MGGILACKCPKRNQSSSCNTAELKKTIEKDVRDHESKSQNKIYDNSKIAMQNSDEMSVKPLILEEKNREKLKNNYVEGEDDRKKKEPVQVLHFEESDQENSHDFKLYVGNNTESPHSHMIDMSLAEKDGNSEEIGDKLKKNSLNCEKEEKFVKEIPPVTTETNQFTKIKECVGLCNAGNTCYFNAVLQVLIRTSKLMKYLNMKKTACDDVRGQNSSIMFQLLSVYDIYLESTESFTPLSMIDFIVNLDGKKVYIFFFLISI